jgi:Rad3-related DNA helicase
MMTDPKYWRALAAGARLKAIQSTDAQSKGAMLAMAESYRSLAEHAERLRERRRLQSRPIDVQDQSALPVRPASASKSRS